MEKQGFIFISEDGLYAQHSISSAGFGPTREVIYWVSDINNATVFPHESMVKHKFPGLAKTQSLKAVETKVVKLTNWGE